MYQFRKLAYAIAFSALTITPAFAEQDCDKSWNLHDVDGSGHLADEEVRKFRDDMKRKGISVGETKTGHITAAQYKKACESRFWEKLEEDER